MYGQSKNSYRNQNYYPIKDLSDFLKGYSKLNDFAGYHDPHYERKTISTSIFSNAFKQNINEAFNCIMDAIENNLLLIPIIVKHMSLLLMRAKPPFKWEEFEAFIKDRIKDYLVPPHPGPLNYLLLFLSELSNRRVLMPLSFLELIKSLSTQFPEEDSRVKLMFLPLIFQTSCSLFSDSAEASTILSALRSLFEVLPAHCDRPDCIYSKYGDFIHRVVQNLAGETTHFSFPNNFFHCYYSPSPTNSRDLHNGSSECLNNKINWHNFFLEKDCDYAVFSNPPFACVSTPGEIFDLATSHTLNLLIDQSFGCNRKVNALLCSEYRKNVQTGLYSHNEDFPEEKIAYENKRGLGELDAKILPGGNPTDLSTCFLFQRIMDPAGDLVECQESGGLVRDGAKVPFSHFITLTVEMLEMANFNMAKNLSTKIQETLSDENIKELNSSQFYKISSLLSSVLSAYGYDWEFLAIHESSWVGETISKLKEGSLLEKLMSSKKKEEDISTERNERIGILEALIEMTLRKTIKVCPIGPLQEYYSLQLEKGAKDGEGEMTAEEKEIIERLLGVYKVLSELEEGVLSGSELSIDKFMEWYREHNPEVALENDEVSKEGTLNIEKDPGNSRLEEGVEVTKEPIEDLEEKEENEEAQENDKNAQSEGKDQRLAAFLAGVIKFWKSFKFYDITKNSLEKEKEAFGSDLNGDQEVFNGFLDFLLMGSVFYPCGYYDMIFQSFIEKGLLNFTFFVDWLKKENGKFKGFIIFGTIYKWVSIILEENSDFGKDFDSFKELKELYLQMSNKKVLSKVF